MLTVLTWLWAQPGGRTQYKAEHVWTWADMVSRNLRMKHRLACVTTETDLPPNVERIDPPGEFEDIVSRKWGNGRPNCFRRLSMFRRDAAKLFGKRFVSMDLDCVVGSCLDPLFERDEDIVLFNGTRPERPYNGSMILLKAGTRPQVYEKFNQKAADISGERFVGSDQAWLAHCLGWGEATWGEPDGVYWFGKTFLKNHRCKPRLLFFPGKLKPWTLREIGIYLFINTHYRIEAKEAA